MFKYLILLILFSCDPSGDKKDDVVVRSPAPPNSDKPESWGEWLSSNFVDASGAYVTLAASELSTGTPAGSISSTYSIANLPIGLFAGGLRQSGDKKYSPMPYLAFSMDKGSNVSVRYIKSVSGKNMQSMAVIPRECPAELAGASERKSSPESSTSIQLVSMCVPLINQIVPDYLKPTDALGAYAHTFIVSIKNPAAEVAKTLNVKLSINILIPDSKLSIKESDDLKALKMRDRLLITSNDLGGSPRRDFKAAVISTELPPGVNTKWKLKFTDLKMRIEEEVFFEMPVAPGQGRLKPNVSRGVSFLKRTTSIDSERNFRLRLIDSYDEAQIVQIQPSGISTVEYPIKDGSAPMRLYVVPDFKSDSATMSMAQYVKPYYPVFCKDQEQIFKPEEWRQASQSIPGFVACESRTRTKVASTADALARSITSPVETFFGSFSYKAMTGQSLGGLSGVLSARIVVTGVMQADVVDPLAPEKSIKVGETAFSFGYNLPSALMDMQDVIRGPNAPAGLDVLYLAIPSKGIIDPPNKPNGQPPFPFINEWSDNVLF